MLYRTNPKNGDEISQIAFGCMRFPRSGGSINTELSRELVKRAVSLGINYFDTAYIYQGVEQALGTILLEEGLRDNVKIATKLPHYLTKKAGDLDRIFRTQLKRLQTDRIDYYLIHMLSDVATWRRLCSLGIKEWIHARRESGEIINIGFSYHGGKNEFCGIIDDYDWDFCMIQYNYIDEMNQAGRSGLSYAHDKGAAVFIMEPLRGGMLINGLPERAKTEFQKEDPDRSLADWGIRWLLDQPEITAVLSGMSSIAQVDENARLGSALSAGCLTDAEKGAYKRVMSIINEVIKVPCTGCGYCLPCPAGVDIPTCFSCYNEVNITSYTAGMRSYFMNTGTLAKTTSFASKCIKCGKCESHCPQRIAIREELANVKRKLEPFWYKPVVFAARKVLKIK